MYIVSTIHQLELLDSNHMYIQKNVNARDIHGNGKDMPRVRIVTPLQILIIMKHGSARLHTREVHQCSHLKPCIERVQALADISHSAWPVCCHSNETREPMANPPNSAQPEGTLQLPPTYIRVRAVVWECGKAQTDRHCRWL